jgi:hypothetical protein
MRWRIWRRVLARLSFQQLVLAATPLPAHAASPGLTAPDLNGFVGQRSSSLVWEVRLSHPWSSTCR